MDNSENELKLTKHPQALFGSWDQTYILLSSHLSFYRIKMRKHKLYNPSSVAAALASSDGFSSDA